MNQYEMRSSDQRDYMVCPKPRRVRWITNHQSEVCGSKSGPEFLDFIFAKGGCDAQQFCTQLASSPPFFSGSPPSRVSNPLIQDARFGEEKITQISPHSIPIPSGESTTSPSSSQRKGGYVMGNFGNKPAVTIEGFDCLDRDNRQNCSIPTLA